MCLKPKRNIPQVHFNNLKTFDYQNCLMMSNGNIIKTVVYVISFNAYPTLSCFAICIHWQVNFELMVSPVTVSLPSLIKVSLSSFKPLQNLRS